MAGAADQAYAALRAGILAGQYAVGSRLGEAELAEAVGVSRTPVREALRRLGSEGLVEVLPNRGARVAQWTKADLHEIYGLRAMLEGYGAAQAAARVGAEEIGLLTALCDEMDAVAAPGPGRDLEALTSLNGRFHDAILRATGNRRLHGLMAAVVHVPLVQQTFYRYREQALRRSMGHHRELVAALGAGDPGWAESVMRTHVLAARSVLLAEAFGEEEP